MYDTINFRLNQDEAAGIDILSEIPNYLEHIGLHDYEGYPTVSGRLNDLKVTVNRSGVNVKDGSICKWYLGDNFQTMGRGDTKQAIEKLSDTLHLPFSKAKVTRLDIAQNFILKNDPGIYINHLGELKGYKRLRQPDSLYYTGTKGILCFYDKVKEQRAAGHNIPELYKGRNCLRYEQRYEHRVSQLLKTEVTGALLYDEVFYIGLLNKWKATYKVIEKINDAQINFMEMKTKSDLYKMGIISLVERQGGELKALNQIAEARKKDELTAKQAYDLKQAIKKACKTQKGKSLMIENKLIRELDKKIDEAIRFYR